MRFFISVSRRKVSHDLTLDVFIIYRAVHLRKKTKSMFLRYILRGCDLEMMHLKEMCIIYCLCIMILSTVKFLLDI